MGETDNILDSIEEILAKYRIATMVDTLHLQGWPETCQEFNRIISEETFACEEEKNTFTDLFFTHVLKHISTITNISQFWDVISHWFHTRKLESRNGHLSANEKLTLIHYCLTLREKLREFVMLVSFEDVEKLSDEHQRIMLALWRMLFFEPFAVMNLYWNPTHPHKELVSQCQNNNHRGLVVASMFEPFAADDFPIDAEQLITSATPFCYKAIIAYWMVNTPYFNAEEKHRRKLMKYIPELCHAIIRHPQTLSSMFFLTFVQEVMTGLWRGSYIGGNNIDALAAFGDFISFTISRAFPYPKPRLMRKGLSQGAKIRVGYLSRNFYKQAVSCYMVNRVVHHNPDKFEVYVFALGDYHDDVSDMFKEHSHSFERFENMTDFQGITAKIREKELDILIYTDIGMDPVTYILSGLQLAPVQCAMVGHGTSTGMPTIQYYLSGDFEGPDAQLHYREKLIRLPNLGAAQYLPLSPDAQLTREEIGIPEDAVVFISCANGIKHGHHRDKLFINILKQAPNAWIILKPFATHASIDGFFTGRITAAAREAGVHERLLILPPIGQTKHVLGLLAIADVQLDSYPYGGWTTNMEALYMGLPIVTQEGIQARSRWGGGMLRSLGISEGIAATEEEYVAWAVRLAQDTQLRQRLQRRIKETAQNVLFNGPAAQPAFEEALTGIYLEEGRRSAFEQTSMQTLFNPAESAKQGNARITIATSLMPGREEIQRVAVQSWLAAGFHLISINALDDIAALSSQFPGVEFIAAPRDARSQYSRSYIYFDDILSYFRHRPIPICGIISPDLCLFDSRLPDLIRKEAPHSFLYGSRVDVDSPTATQGQVYNAGFDYFFFAREAIAHYPQQEFCLELPWWDYWAVIAPLMRKMPVKQITTPVAVHVKHPHAGSAENWFSLGKALSENLKPPFALTWETMPRFADETLSIINKLSEQVSL